MTRPAAVTAFFVATLLVAQGHEAARAGDSFAPRPDATVSDWYQRRGNAARSAVSTFKPIRTEPEFAWRVKLAGDVNSNIVTWDGYVFVSVRNEKRKRAEIYAFSVEDGKKAGVRPLEFPDAVELAVWNGTVIVVQRGALSYHGYRRGTFRMPAKWSGSEEFQGSPLVYDGKVHVRTRGNELLTLQIGSKSTEPESVGECGCRPMAAIVDHTPRLVRAWIGDDAIYAGEYLKMDRGFRSVPAVGNTRRGSARSPDFVVHHLQKQGTPRGGWLVMGRIGIRAKSGVVHGVVFPPSGDGFYPYDLDSEAVVAGGQAYAWTRGNRLLEISLDGGSKMMEGDVRPKGFSGYELSAARDVLYAGNAAVEMGSRRVLWCLPDLDANSPMIPAGDGRVVVLDGRELVGLVGGTGATDGRGQATASTGPPPMPKDADGVLLTSGEQVLGAVQVLDDGKVRVTPTGGAARDISPVDVAVATAGGEVVGPRNEYLAYRVCRDAARGEIATGFRELFLRFMRERMLTQAREVLELARSFGLPESEVAELGARFTGLSENPGADSKRERVERQRSDRARELSKHVTIGAAWLEARGLRRAAAALLSETDALVPRSTGWHERAKSLISAEFPFADHEDAGRLWARWARATLPSGATFLTEDDPAWEDARRPPWNDGAIGLRSENVVIISRSMDPEIVGGCLQRGEAAVAALEELLDLAPPTEPEPPLRVLLHRNQKEYLAEKTPAGGAPSWSAGYYSPVENVSRFFVASDDSAGDPLGRDLFSTLAHELTHHWIDHRWAQSSRGSAIVPGYWVVEGIAQFVGDQAADSDPYTIRLDNSSVPSLDAMAQAGAAGKSLDVAPFVDLPQLGFAALGGDPIVTVQLRNTLGGRRLSQRALFYEQSAAFTWFMMNRRGDDGRERLRRYLWAYYQGEAPRGGWASLGFETPEEMTKLFQAFLAELAGRPVRLRTGEAAEAGPDELPAANPEGVRRKKAAPTSTIPIPGTGEFDIGDDVWVEFEGEYWGGSITGMIDGKFWVSFGHEGVVKRVLVPTSQMKKR